ncbi:MAG: NUDIX hydrolase [Candidatus Nanopelagicales bacterium]
MSRSDEAAPGGQTYLGSPGERGRPGRSWLVPASYLFLRDDLGRVLLQKRAGTGFMDGHWAAAAAGHVDPGESALAAVIREAREELGVELAAADVQPVTTMHRCQIADSPIDQRVDFFFSARHWSGEPRTMEPGKSAGIRWFALDALPTPVVAHELAVLRLLASGGPPAILTWGFAG